MLELDKCIVLGKYDGIFYNHLGKNKVVFNGDYEEFSFEDLEALFEYQIEHQDKLSFIINKELLELIYSNTKSDLAKLVIKHQNCFKYVEHCDEYLVTSCGISNHWYQKVFRPVIIGFKNGLFKSKYDIIQQLNIALSINLGELNHNSSPVSISLTDLTADPLKGFKQIIYGSPHQTIKTKYEHIIIMD